MVIITIDCGASFFKAARFYNGKLEKQIIYSKAEMSQVEVEEREEVLPPRLREIVSSLKVCLSQLTYETEDILLVMSNEMHGFVLTDNNMIPCMDYVSWQVEWAKEEREQDNQLWEMFFKNMLDEDLVLKTGMPFKSGLPSSNLAYLVWNKNISLDTCRMFTLGDFVLSWFMKQEIPIHPTNAAATGLYDVIHQCWNKELLQALRLDKLQLPNICIGEPKASYHKWKQRNIRCLPAVGDQQAALLGSSLMEENHLSINMGTGAQVAMLSPMISLSKDYQTRPYFKGLHIKTIPHIPSGRAMNVFFNFVYEILSGYLTSEVREQDVWDWIYQQALFEKDTEKQLLDVDLSFFSNAVSDNTRGKITDITEDNMRIGWLFYSIYNNMAENVWKCVQRLCDVNMIKKIIMAGGVVTKNEILRKLILEHFQEVDCEIVGDGTMYGLEKYAKWSM